MKDIIYALNLGMTVIISFVFGIGLGYFIDYQFTLNGMGMVIGIMIGACMAFGSIFRMMRVNHDG